MMSCRTRPWMPILVTLGVCLLATGLASGLSPVSGADDGGQILTIDHYVRVESTVPAMAGEFAQIYVRERVRAAAIARGTSLTDRVVVFVHGAGTPGEVAFDVPYQDYSWMVYLAERGFDVFSIDFTGYGRSTRPAPMNDPCNLAAGQQGEFIGSVLSAPCDPSYPYRLATVASNWDDLDVVVDYVRELRDVDRVSFVGWSLGAPRSGGYALRHPDKVGRLVLLAPAFGASSSSSPPASLPADGVAFNKQSRADFTANWDRQVGCPDQYDPAVHDVVWSEMLASDPVGATWGLGVRRAPGTTVWGWNDATVADLRAPTLLVAGIHDRQVPPERVQALHQAIGSSETVLVDLACSSHNAMWERSHLLLFRASWQWLAEGSIDGSTEGVIRLGY